MNFAGNIEFLRFKKMSKVANSLKTAFNGQQIRSISSATAAITKIHRAVYARVHPVVVVNPDGSTINIRYPEPRQIIRVRLDRWDTWSYSHLIHLPFSLQLPLNLNTLTEAERKKRLEARKPRIKVKIEDDLESSFDAKKYLKYIKK